MNMLFFVLVMLFAIQGFSSSATLDFKGNVGKCLVVGETLVLNCSIADWTDINEPDLKLLQIQHIGRRVTNHSIIGNRTVQAVILDMGKGDGGAYSCCYKQNPKIKLYLLFKVKEPDPMPQDIDCIANGAATRINCIWSSRDLCAIWRLFYSTTHRGDRKAKCVLPVQNVPRDCAENTIDSSTLMKTYCHKNPPEGEPLQLRCSVDVFFGSDFSLRLERSSPTGTEEKILKKTFDETIVKLDAEQNLQVHSSPKTISIDWTFPYPPNYYHNGIVCVVSCGRETKLLKFPGNDTNYDVRGILFSDLRPFTDYNITVTCQVAGSRYWGDPIERTYQTEEDIPLFGPHTTDNSYSLAGCISGTSGTCLIIHTKLEETLNVNGNICGYTVKIRCEQEPKLNQWFNFSNTPTTLEIGPLDNGMIPPFDVSIWSKTSKGLSNKSTDIVINPSKDITFEEVIVEEEGATYLITAELSSSSASSEFICHWCYGLKPDKTVLCKAGYGYRSSSKSEFLIEKTELDGSCVIGEDTNEYRWHFGISVNTGADSTGIHWENCIFQSTKLDRSPPQPERPVLSEGIRNQVVVQIQSFCPSVDSNSESFRPMNYTVVCTNNDDIHDERTKTFEARYNNDRLEMNNLKPGSTYHVKYNIGYRQSTSPFSEPASKYISAQPQTKLIVGLAVGITLALLFGMMIIRKLAKWYKKIEQPIEGVEIDNKNWDKTTYVDPTCCNDDMRGAEVLEAEDATNHIVTGCNNAPDPLHHASKFLGTNPETKDLKLASRNSADIFNPQYEIIGSIMNGGNLNEDFSDKLKSSENIVAADFEMHSNESFTPDGVMQTEESGCDESGICNQFLTTNSGYPDSIVDDTQGIPQLLEYKSMNGNIQSVSEVMLDEQDIAVTLLSVTEREEIDDEEDLYHQHLDDVLAMQTNSLICTDPQFPSRQNKNIGISKLPEKQHLSLSGYKQLPQTDASREFKPHQSHDMFQISERDDEPCDSDGDLDVHVATEPFVLIETLDTRQLETLLELDDTSGESPDLCGLGLITEPVVKYGGSRNPAKPHYKSLPCF